MNNLTHETLTPVNHVVTVHFFVTAFLFPFLLSLAMEAWANDLPSTVSAAITLDNRTEMLLLSGKIPLAENHQFDIFISPGAAITLAAGGGLSTAAFKQAGIQRTSGKIMLAGGIGKNILTVSAGIFDSDTHSWLTKHNVALGRGGSSIPFNGRVLVWFGIIVPF